ncbi:MFS transporter [Azohydromonas caseinilytica]|uniref:MFS transporter n=1 Tax=Azohydromonas caseinilytica TaxID=2728836 RepID=A0A848FH07_9BURK|nr:MFS transporter [Azohydromonas caseinilytica]NML17470.1 MFS transporter [Azohydromonas caseinilytica]
MPSATDAAPDAPSGALAPLRIPVFRMLWSAWLTANLCLWMNDVAAAWVMTTLSTDPALVALVQTASTLPVFLLGLPSGALADIVNRRRWFMFTQLWVAAVGVVLAAVSMAGLLTAPLLLALVFVNGIGLAMRWPVFAAIVPELVGKRELSAALALNGVAMNASRIAGPIAAGAIIASLGSAWVFALNAVLSVMASYLVWRWRYEPRHSALPGERFVGAMRVGVQHVRESPGMRIVLLRVFVFFLQATALIALLPIEAQRLQGGGAGTFTLLLACMGAGAIAAALALPQLRARWDRDQLVEYGTLINAAAMTGVALSPNVWTAAPLMVLGGAAWISVANSLTITAQLTLPNWVRARGMSIYQMALMAGNAVGAALWGQIASLTDVRTSLLAAAATAVLLVLLLRRHRLEAVPTEDHTPQPVKIDPPPAFEIAPEAGPVMVTIEYFVDEADAAEFAAVMRDSRRARLRQGALSWGLLHDSTDPRRHLEYFVDESWVEHQRRIDRITASDMQLRQRRLAFHKGSEPPRVRRYVGETLPD